MNDDMNKQNTKYSCNECRYYEYGCMAPFAVNRNINGNCSGFKKPTALGTGFKLPVTSYMMGLEQAAKELREEVDKSIIDYVNGIDTKDNKPVGAPERDDAAYIKKLEDQINILSSENAASLNAAASLASILVQDGKVRKWVDQ